MKDAQFLTSPLLGTAGFRHAFFTRLGGVSEGPYASLNFSFSVGDEAWRVRENLERAGRCLSIAPERICFVSQVHGREVLELAVDERRDAVMRREADAVIARSGPVACAVRSADCVPVLLADTHTGAVAAIHSGWRGTVANVVAAAIARLSEDPRTLIAAIGPHISREAFEVSSDVASQLQNAAPGVEVISPGALAKAYVDLRGIVTAQLLEVGVPPAGIDQVTGCTLKEPERFFSFRRDGAKSGRLLSTVVPRQP